MMTATTPIITVGMPVAPSFEVKKAVSGLGKLATALSPMVTRASPRKSARVPMVTASDGSPSTAIRKPLNIPHTNPTSRLTASTSQISMPPAQSTPMVALVSPAMLATERSISPVMMISVIGMAISRTGITSRSKKPVVTGDAKRGMLAAA